MNKTTDGKFVAPGMFRMVDTHGLPLADVLFKLRQRDMVMDWYSFVQDARNAGWSDKTIHSRVREATIDAYGLDYSNEVMLRLEKL